MRQAPATLEVLIVDDDPGDVRIVREAIKEVGARVRLSAAADGEECLEVLRRRGRHADAVRPHLVILDLNMPRRNGLETLRAIKQDPALASIPVVVLTTSESGRDIEAAYAAHANCLVSKPLDLDGYVAVLRSLAEFWTRVAALPGVA
jgi:two-component system, chemotaxis family, response regulator Rcp1